MFSVKLLPNVHAFCSNSYLITSMGECAVVDPSSPYRNEYGRVKYVLLTHAHFDHMLDIASWVEEGGATVIVSPYDISALDDPYKNCSSLFMMQDFKYSKGATPLGDGERLTLGDEVIELIATPGHTPGSTVYKIADATFVGDLVFSGGGYGRTDLPGGDFAELRASIDKLLGFNGLISLFTGHGEATTLQEYKKQYENFLR